MNHNEFKDVYDRAFVMPLFDLGFTFVGRGKTLQFLKGTRELRIIRLGGRMERPGVWRSVICFRHTFLRPVKSDDPNQMSLDPVDFPRRFTFQDFNGWLRPKLNYRCPNKYPLPIYDLDYSDLNERSATKQLQTLVKITTDKVMPWVHKVTEAGELAQIKQHGVQDWNELRWIEDYEQFLRETLQ